MSQRQLAERLQLSKQSLSEFERGAYKRPPAKSRVSAFIDLCLEASKTDPAVAKELRGSISREYELLVTASESEGDRVATAGYAQRAPLSRKDPLEGYVGTPSGLWTIPAPESGLTNRPEHAEPLITALIGPAVTLGITTALYGAGGFGKTTLARQVCDDSRVRSRFSVGIWVTIGQTTRGTQLAEKINDLSFLLTRERPNLTDPEQAGLHLGELLDRREDVLLIIDDVWRKDQLGPLLNGGASSCSRLITTRRPNILPTSVLNVAVKVNQLTDAQTRRMFARDLPELPPRDLRALIKLTGRWPLLVQLSHRYLAFNIRNGEDPARTLSQLVRQFHFVIDS